MERRTARGRRPLTAGLVGREKELAGLETLVSDLQQGRGGTALIEGPAGIGKTRLVEAVLAMASRAGVVTAFASADPLGVRRPFHVILSALASLADHGRMSAGDLARSLDAIDDAAESLALVAPGSARVQAMEILIGDLRGGRGRRCFWLSKTSTGPMKPRCPPCVPPCTLPLSYRS